jgi:glycosyltransferase involved in cell wall biosynthesis
MKITFILPHARLEGGVRVVAIYAELLRQRGHEVFVVSWPAKPLRRRENLKLVISKNDNKVKEASHFDLYPYVPHKIIESRRPVVDADLPDADVVIATWWETAEWVAELAPNKGRKFYFIQHHEASFDYLPQERVEKTYLLPLKKITISNWLVELMKKRYGDPDVPMIFNSVDTKLFYSPERKKQETPTVGMLYSSVNWKGCDVSLKAFALAKKRLPNLQLIVFGDDISDVLPLPEGAKHFKQPEQKSLSGIYKLCDVWLCGSRAEGFHLPPLEAMACRCPVVSTLVGGPADIIKDGVNGYLVPQEDVGSLSSKLLHVLTLSDEDWLEMSDQAYKTATQYTWDDAASLFENALN